jgi:hypothetical protein
MLVPCQADPHTDVDTTNDPALMALRSVGARHRGAIFPHHRRVPIPPRHHQQIHHMAGSNSSGQNQQAIHSKIHQVHHM